MKILSKIILYTFVSLSVFAAGCDYEVEESSDYYNFTIIGNNGPFHGTYKVDSSNVVNFVSAPGGAYYEIYEKNLTAPGVITITADANNNTVTSLRIFIYQGSDVVASASKYQLDTETIGLELTYTFTASDNSK